MRHVVIIGAGAGGLASALALAGRGVETTVLERAGAVGGKMRQTPSPAGPVDAGPTVFTMRFLFEELFASAGLALEDFLRLRPAERLARHAWPDGARLDLFTDVDASADAVAAFAGAREADGYRRFTRDAARVYAGLWRHFMRTQQPSPLDFARRAGPAGLWRLAAGHPFRSLWAGLGGYFRDQRLRQLFARYATYCGADPFLAPATLMVIAHVEQAGVWSVEGGMHGLAQAMADAARLRGAQIRLTDPAARILVENGRAVGVLTARGETLAADAVILNADSAALSAGLFGDAAATAVDAPRGARSMSAITWTGAAQTAGFPLAHHSVFFSADYRREFAALRAGRLPDDPTVYVCAQDRRDTAPPMTDEQGERLLILANAPAGAGLTLAPRAAWTRTTPQDFARMFPASRGAIYGAANHGPMGSFARPKARTRLAGLYLAGGTAHPSAGAPMAALSGLLAVEALFSDQPSMPRSPPADMSGGISMRSVRTAAMD
jgi:1-hydroxycarotenoid 3,4-desaturase